MRDAAHFLHRLLGSRYLLWPAIILLVAAAALRVLLYAHVKHLGADERTALGEIVDFSFGYLLYAGPMFELNRSPLHYLLDKSWFVLWGEQPQLHWNLRVFFRILPATYWAIATAAIFFFAHRALRRMGERGWIVFLGGLAVALSFYTRNLLLNFAAEDRPYALWMLFSTLHTVFFVLWHRRAIEGRDFFPYFAFVSVALVFTAYVSMIQIALAAMALWLFPPIDWNARDRRRLLWLTGSCAGIGIWYFSGVFSGPPKPSQLGLILDAFRHVAYSSMRLYDGVPSQWWPAYGPGADLWGELWCVFCLLAPLYFWRRREVRAYLALTYGLLVALIVVAVVLRTVGHGILGSRYVLFLFPYLFGLTVLTLMALFDIVRRIPFVGSPLVRWGKLPAACALLWLTLDPHLRELEFHQERGHIEAAFRWHDPLPSCPREFGSMRGGKDSIEAQHYERLCRDPEAN